MNILSVALGSLLVFLVAISAAVSGGELPWPVKGEIDLSQGFCEFRSGHFHGGIDIRTNKKVGRKLFSPVDGYVWRIKLSYIGYGKGLYLKDSHGDIYVFGHLSGFAEKIQKVVRQKQYNSQRYYFDLYFEPDSIPVKQGELIAYSGQTGYGAPHIHFERRTADNQPTNPLTNGFNLDDKMSPIFRTVGFIYRDSVSLFPSGGRRLDWKVKYNREEKTYFLDTIICFTGAFGVTIDAFDRIRERGPELNIYRAKLFIDDYLYYDVRYEKYDYSQTKMVDLSYDFPLAAAKKGYRHLLFEPPGKIFAGSKSQYKDGGIFFSQSFHSLGRHEGRIEIYDAAGNSSELKFQFALLPTGNLFSSQWMNDSTLYLMANTDNRYLDIADVLVYTFDRRKKWRKIHPSRVEARGSGDYLVTLPRVEDGFRAIRVKTEGVSGWEKSDPYLPLSREIESPIKYQFTHEPVDGGILFKAACKMHYIVSPEVEINYEDGYSKRIRLRSYAPNKFAAFYRNDKISAKIIGLALFDEGFDIASVGEEVDIFLVGLTPGERTVASSEMFRFTVDSDDLYSPANIEVRRRKKGVPKSGRVVGDVYEINPVSLPLAGGIDLSFKINAKTDRTKIGIYRLNHKKEWKWLDSEIKENRIEARSGRTGIFGMLYDGKAPRVKKIYPPKGKTVTSGYPKIRFIITDDLAGIGDDRNIIVLLDGQWLIPEYDPETEWLKTYPRQQLADGRHELKITVSDRLGNSRTVHSHFYVKGG